MNSSPQFCNLCRVASPVATSILFVGESGHDGTTREHSSLKYDENTGGDVVEWRERQRDGALRAGAGQRVRGRRVDDFGGGGVWAREPSWRARGFARGAGAGNRIAAAEN